MRLTLLPVSRACEARAENKVAEIIGEFPEADARSKALIITMFILQKYTEREFLLKERGKRGII